MVSKTILNGKYSMAFKFEKKAGLFATMKCVNSHVRRAKRDQIRKCPCHIKVLISEVNGKSDLVLDDRFILNHTPTLHDESCPFAQNNAELQQRIDSFDSELFERVVKTLEAKKVATTKITTPAKEKKRPKKVNVSKQLQNLSKFKIVSRQVEGFQNNLFSHDQSKAQTSSQDRCQDSSSIAEQSHQIEQMSMRIAQAYNDREIIKQQFQIELEYCEKLVNHAEQQFHHRLNQINTLIHQLQIENNELKMKMFASLQNRVRVLNNPLLPNISSLILRLHDHLTEAGMPSIDNHQTFPNNVNAFDHQQILPNFPLLIPQTTSTTTTTPTTTTTTTTTATATSIATSTAFSSPQDLTCAKNKKSSTTSAPQFDRPLSPNTLQAYIDLMGSLVANRSNGTLNTNQPPDY